MARGEGKIAGDIHRGGRRRLFRAPSFTGYPCVCERATSKCEDGEDVVVPSDVQHSRCQAVSSLERGVTWGDQQVQKGTGAYGEPRTGNGSADADADKKQHRVMSHIFK